MVDLKSIPTCELVEELKTREGVETFLKNLKLFHHTRKTYNFADYTHPIHIFFMV